MTVKITSKDLREKTKEELIKMKTQMEINLMTYKRKVAPDKGMNHSEARKNIARINTIIKELE